MDGPQSESRSNGLGMLLISPVVFSGWFVRFFDERVGRREREGASHAAVDSQLQAVIMLRKKLPSTRDCALMTPGLNGTRCSTFCSVGGCPVIGELMNGAALK